MHSLFPRGGQLFVSPPSIFFCITFKLLLCRKTFNKNSVWKIWTLMMLGCLYWTEISGLQVDHLISQNHLLKRSIILIKAWCYYESRILGAHHGLISTYALETLVLYIFHVFNNSFTGPLEVGMVIFSILLFFSWFSIWNIFFAISGPLPFSGVL